MGIGEIPPSQIPQVLAGGVGRVGHSEAVQHQSVGHFFQTEVPHRRQTYRNSRSGQCKALQPAKPIVVPHPLSGPAQKLIQHTGVCTDVVAGHHTGAEQLRQGAHQLQPHAVAAFSGHPDAHPHIGTGGVTGKNVARGAQIPAVLLRHSKLRHIAPALIVIVIQLRTVEQRQPHVKMAVDERRNGRPLSGACQTKDRLRQWRTLP